MHILWAGCTCSLPLKNHAFVSIGRSARLEQEEPIFFYHFCLVIFGTYTRRLLRSLLLGLVVPCLPACLSACSSASTRLEEIYVVSIGAFAGRGFSDLVRELFELHGVILLGISEDRRVVLHPGAGYVITEVRWRRSFTLWFISGHVICSTTTTCSPGNW